jgi:PAS domain S-box-containing protein
MMDFDKCICFVNMAACRMFGYTIDEMMGENLHRLIAPSQYLNSFENGFEMFRNTGEGVVVGRTVEIEGKRKSGNVFPVELSISSTELDGRWYAVGVIRDISDRKRIESEIIEARKDAENASRIKSEFLTNMSHEIRTPLNSIIGTAELLSETRLDDEQKKYLKLMQESGKNLLILLNDILEVSQIEAGKITLDTVLFSLKNTVEKVHRLLNHRVLEKGLELTCEIQDNVPDLLIGDPERLVQIIVNLVGNAIKFTEEGSIRIEITRVQNTEKGVLLSFSITDTGIGIPQAKLDSIFSSFTQVDQSLTRKYGGTGLGLAISRNLVGLMNGEISVKSLPGHGSSFTFSAEFGIASNPEGSSKEESEKSDVRDGSPGELHSLRILLVDDSPDNRFLVRAFLKLEECHIEEAVNGHEAIQKYENSDWDVILMDMQMPEVDGYEATSRIREIESVKGMVHVPIVALTAHSMDSEVKKCLDAGCDVYLSKPIDKVSLIRTISEVSHPASERVMNGTSEADKLHPEKEKAIRVKVDPELMDLIPGYLNHRREDIVKIRELLNKGDFRSVERCGHSMKGTGGSYGFDGITQIGALIEEAGKARNTDAVNEGVEQLSSYLNNLELLEEE